MPRYINTSGATLIFQGVTFKPKEIHNVPSPIHSRVMYPTNLPCTDSNITITDDVVIEQTSDTAEVVSSIETVSNITVSNEPKVTNKSKSKKSNKEETDGTDNDK